MLRTPVVLFAGLAAAAIACTKPNPDVCCTTIEQCQAIDVNDLRPCSAARVCVDNKCLVSVDAVSVDAVVDARGVHVFDVVYPKEWRFSVENTVKTDTLQLKSLVDDNPAAIVLVTATPAADQIPQGSAAGALSTQSRQLLVDSGLVAEPRSNTPADFMTLGLQGGPGGNYDINVDVVLSLGDIDIPISMVIHVLDTLVVWQDPIVGHRAPVFRN